MKLGDIIDLLDEDEKVHLIVNESMNMESEAASICNVAREELLQGKVDAIEARNDVLWIWVKAWM